jgi:tripartite-type tricarboxylate transporter receptor subunit TctC
LLQIPCKKLTDVFDQDRQRLTPPRLNCCRTIDDLNFRASSRTCATTQRAIDIKAGELRALAVKGAMRCARCLAWQNSYRDTRQTFGRGISASKHTPSATIAKLNKEVNVVLAYPQKRFAKLGTTVLGGSPDYFGKL